jgi:hypothetical protein
MNRSRESIGGKGYANLTRVTINSIKSFQEAAVGIICITFYKIIHAAHTLPSSEGTFIY